VNLDSLRVGAIKFNMTDDLARSTVLKLQFS